MIYIFLALTAGAFLVLAILESSRFLGDLLPLLDGAQVTALKEITIALVLILILRFKPAGLIPERLPRHLPPGGATKAH